MTYVLILMERAWQNMQKFHISIEGALEMLNRIELTAIHVSIQHDKHKYKLQNE